MKLLITNNFNVLCTGPTGTGKSLNALTLLMSRLGENY